MYVAYFIRVILLIILPNGLIAAQTFGDTYAIFENTKCGFNLSEELTTNTISECAARCEQRSACLSVNYKKNLCEILVFESSSEETLIAAIGWNCLRKYGVP